MRRTAFGIVVGGGIVSCVSWLLAGCGGSTGAIAVGRDASVSGTVMGGRQPVGGATLHLYATRTGGMGAAAADLLPTGTVSQTDGSFDLSGVTLACPTSATPTYLVALGGDAGSGANVNAGLMAALGNSGSLGGKHVVMNELTTVAAVWALAPFMTWAVNNVAVSNATNGSIAQVTNTGAAVSPTTGYVSSTLGSPYGIAIDPSGNVWVGNTTSVSLTEFVGVATPTVTPLALAAKNGLIGTLP